MKRLYILFVFIALGIISESCKKDEEKSIDKDFFCSIVPEGWTCEFIDVENKYLYVPDVTFKPEFIVKYNLPDSVFSYNNVEYNPQIIINVYPIAKSEVLDIIIGNQMPNTSCIPVYFGKNTPYYITTTPCFINYNLFTEESNKLLEPLLDAFSGSLSSFNQNLLN